MKETIEKKKKQTPRIPRCQSENMLTQEFKYNLEQVIEEIRSSIKQVSMKQMIWVHYSTFFLSILRDNQIDLFSQNTSEPLQHYLFLPLSGYQ